MKSYKNLIAAFTFLLATNASANIILSAVPSASNVMSGDSVTVDLVISGLGEGGPDSLGAFDVNIGYDAAVLSVDGYNLSSLLGNIDDGEASAFSLGDNGGIINLSVVSFLFDFELDDLQTAIFIFASIDFSVDALAEGSSTFFSYDFFILSDAFGFELTPDSATGALITNRAVVGVSAPAMGAIFALAGLALFRRQPKV